MSNNLRQIAKDLRSFVKRCKDVHYSDSLLITFLVTGLLTTFAPSIIRADVAEDQQEVSAQAYDTITDLRQSFLRAKKENQKALRGANAELAQLLKEGDQVVKSPWASFQFGTGYTNNDWGTSYKGRGGKKLEYYSRTNDLTKYVFDASKHQYGATNLNLPRNQEPNTLAITPANIHEPYKPYDVTKLDAIALPTAPTFEPNMPAPNGVTPYDFTYYGTSASRSASTAVDENTNAINNAVSHNNRYTTYTTNTGNQTNASGVTNTASSASSGTIVTSTGTINNTRYWWWPTTSYTVGAITDISGGTFTIGSRTVNTYSNWWYGGAYGGHWSDYGNVSIVAPTARGTYWGGQEADGTYTGGTTAAVGRPSSHTASATSLAIDYLASLYLASNPNDTWSTARTWASGHITPKWTWNTGTSSWDWVQYEYSAIPNGAAGNFSDTQTLTYATLPTTQVDASILADSATDIRNNTFNITDGNNKHRAGVIVKAAVNGSGNKFYINGDNNDGVVVATGGDFSTSDKYYINGNATGLNNGVYLSAGKVTATGALFDVNSYKSNGINNQAGDLVSVSGGTFTIAGNESNGIYSKKGDVITKSATFKIESTTKGNGIFADGNNAKVEDEGSTFTITGNNNNNGIYATKGDVTTKDTKFVIGGTTKNNGIVATANVGTTTVTGTGSNTSKFTINTGVTESNGIYIDKGKLDVDNVTFSINEGRTGGPAGDKNTAIRLTNKADQDATVNRAYITVHGTDSAGIWSSPHSSAKLNVTNSSITVGNGAGTNNYNNNGIYSENRELISTNTSYTINGYWSNGVFATGSKDVTFNGGTMNINGSGNNGYIDKSTGTDKVQNMTFNVYGTSNNGIFATSAGQTISEISGTALNPFTFNVNNNNIGLLVGDVSGEAEVTKVENTVFNIENTNAADTNDKGGTAIYLYNSKDTKLGENVVINGGGTGVNEGNDILITIRNRNRDDNPATATTNKLSLGGDAGTKRTLLNATGSNNIGINIQQGTTDQTSEVEIVTLNNASGDPAGWNLHFEGGTQNTGIKNNFFAKKLHIENKLKDDSSPSSLYDSGVMAIYGDDGIMFANLGYVQDGNLRLDGISMQGKRSIGAAFLNNQYSENGTPTLNNRLGNSGIFNTGSTGGVALQGSIGANSGPHLDSSNSVAIFANTGQRADFRETAVGHGSGSSAQISDLTVTGLNVGLNQFANNSVLLWSERGTKIKVTNTLGGAGGGTASYTSSGGNGHVSDGVMIEGGKTVHGYNTNDDVVSTNSVIAYATGFLDAGKHGYSNLPSISYLPSEVEFGTGVNVDMVAKKGTALLANHGAKITAKSVRAGGIESILAYAEGKHTTIDNGIVDYTPSQIEIDGQIVAADNNLLGKNNVAGVLDAGKVKAADLPKTYNNIGAYATGGGTITIKNSAVSDTTLEGNGTGSLNVKAAPTKSLIFGMAAYATGEGSKVKFDSAKTSVVTGVYGGLYATDKGQIEFAGDIINQNNYGTTVASKDNGNDGALTAMAANSERRNGRGTSSDVKDNRGNTTINDHKNVTPFYVKRTLEGDTATDDSGIVFNDDTNIDMADGILFTGNQYNVRNYTYNNGAVYNTIRDYHKDVTKPGGDEGDKWTMAKYRGMSKVKTAIVNDNYAVELGVINQANGLKWDNDGNTGNGTNANSYLGTLGTQYAGGMELHNKQVNGTATNASNTKVGHLFNSTLINSTLEINSDKVDLEDADKTDVSTLHSSRNDPFNDIKMESTLVTISDSTEVIGDVANGYRAGQGLNMANRLWRWETPDSKTSRWVKTSNEQSGYVNKGKINVYGGLETAPITGLNVAFGTAQNIGSANAGKIDIDHGYGIYGTDASLIKNTGKITVSGKYNPANISQLRQNRNISAENVPSGENYGIVGISDTDIIDYNIENNGSVINSVSIEQSGADAETKVEGKLAVGIYGENRNNALASNIKIKYDNSSRTNAGIDVSNPNVTLSTARGVGIALVNGSSTTYADGALNAGGEITLNGFGGNIGQFGAAHNDILTGKNGVGVYAESAEIKVDSAKFAVETKDNGIGLWAMDDTVIARGADHDKTFNYNYNGAKDKNGFAMAFGGRNTNATTAANYMDILFSNKADATNVNLKNEDATGRTGTNKGIVGLLVNTNDAADKVTNYGKIEEDTSSKTNLKAYGALVNKGTFINHGDITLNASLMNDKNSTITTADMKKVNVGILANDHSERARDNSYIENYANITIGQDADSKNNVGSWAIYGYNIKTGAKLDGTEVVYKINRNSNGIYSGDGNVDIQKGTVLKVGNDTVLGHVRPTQVVNGITMPSRQPDTTGTGYADPDDLLSGLDNPRERDSAVGVYINNNRGLSDQARTINIAADMDIDRFSHGIVLAEKDGGAVTTVNMGTSAATAPRIKLAYSTANNPGGQVHSTKPYEPEIFSEEVNEQGNAVYYYSADTNSKAKSYANVTMDGDYNTAYFTKGSVTNYGNIDLRSQYDLELRNNDPDHIPVGYGSVGIISENTTDPSINEGKIITGLSDTQNMMYSVGMGAGRNFYRIDPSTRERVYDRTEGQGYVVNNGEIVVQEENGIGMLATGRGSRAINNGTIRLVGKNGVGMYIDREAIGENHGTITGDAENLKGVVAINGGYIKNYGTIKVEGTGSYGIVTDSSKFTLDANGNPIAYHTDTSSAEYRNGTTAGQANGHGGTDLYGGTETSIEEGTTGNPKTTGVGTTITRPNIVPLTSVTIDGVEQPIFNFNNDADVVGKQAENILVTSSIQTVATGATELQIPIWLRAKDEYGNPAWPRYNSPQMSEVTRIGMYVDTSGVRYTNPIDGIEKLTNLGKVNLYFGPEITEYTNSKAIRIANNRKEVAPGQYVVEENNILKPFNDALRRLPGGATINPLSSSLTWQVSANIDDNNQITELVMSKVPYHSFAFDGDKRLINFTNNLDNIYEIARPGSEEKMIFNKLNSIGNGEGHILAQAFDQMRGHIYGGIQQRTNATSNLLTDELAQLRSENNASKDSNKIKAFGRREEYKTDTAGLPDWHSNAGGFVYLHEDETVKLGDRSGWYAGVVNNYFTFKDLARSYENQAMLKTGIFKQTPLDEDGTFTFTIGGDAFFGKTNTKRRFWVVDKEFRAKSDYYTYGADINAKLEKEFRLTEGFSIVPNVGLDLQYGRFSTVNEDGDMALKIKSDDYYSVKPRAGVDFRYSQPVFKKSNFVASVGVAYETELGRLNDVDNEAKIKGAWTDYYSIKGDKEDRKGNFKSDLKLGLDNGRLGFTVNTGYDTKGHNFRAGLGLRALF